MTPVKSDLVDRLRERALFIQDMKNRTDEAVTASHLEDAASRIEELEKALELEREAHAMTAMQPRVNMHAWRE